MTTRPGSADSTAHNDAAEQTGAAPSPGPKPGPRPKPAEKGKKDAAHTKGGDGRKDSARDEALAAFPLVALSIQTTGIHPSTGRLLTVDALTFNDAGETGQEFHAVFNPDGDPGPRHLHGLSVEEIKAGQSFSALLKPLDRLIDGRTLIVHDTTYTWGFLVAEARRAMTAAARQNRARNRNRSKGRRRRFKVGHVPTPVTIVDTLATARRQGVWGTDVRLAAVAAATGLDAPSPKASAERALRPEKETSRETTRLLVELYRAQRGGTLSTAEPDDLRGDRFGLQRSHVRVDAAEAPRQHHNPGAYVPGKELIRGMEIVVAPEISEDPDTIIAALAREELNYSEKLTRETSLVVCNITTDLVGKPMHAHRKDIPLMSDTAFLAALERIEDATEPEDSEDSSSNGGSAQRSGGSRTGQGGQGGHGGGQNNRSRSSNNRRRRSRRKSGNKSGAKAGNRQNASAGAQAENGSTASQNDGGAAKNNGGQGSGNTGGGNRNGGRGGNGRRRRRRGGRGRRGQGQQNQQKQSSQQNSGHNRSRTTDQ